MRAIATRIPTGWLDLLLAVALLVTCEADVIGSLDGRDARSLAAAIAVVALTLPIALRRRTPLAVACCAMASVVVLAAVLPGFNSLGSPMFVLVVPPYSVAAHARRRPALAGLVVCLVGAIVVNLLRPDGLISLAFSTGNGRCVVGGRACAALAAGTGV